MPVGAELEALLILAGAMILEVAEERVCHGHIAVAGAALG